LRGLISNQSSTNIDASPIGLTTRCSLFHRRHHRAHMVGLMDCEVQCEKCGSKDVFVHISAVERAGMTNLNEGQKVSFEVVANRKTGKSSAENLRAV
jgi:cold shock CspA family protein